MKCGLVMKVFLLCFSDFRFQIGMKCFNDIMIWRIKSFNSFFVGEFWGLFVNNVIII